MKVLVSAYACLPNAGTEPGHGWGTASHLAQRGMDVHVLTQFENKGRIESFLQGVPIPRLHFHYLDHSLGRLRNDGLRYLLWQRHAVGSVRALHAIEKFDIVHHVTYGSVHVPTQLWRTGIPVVFGPVGGGQVALQTMLGYFGADRAKEQRRTLLTRLIQRSPLHRRWLSHMDTVLVSNRETMDLVKGLGRQDVQLMFDTVIPDSFRAEAPRIFAGKPTPLKVLWVGRMLPRKGLALSLDILEKVQVPVALTIIGNGMDAAVVKRMIADRNLHDRVIWQDRRLPWGEVREAYRTHDVLLFNSLRETGGAQLVEAMALGLPIVTLNAQGPRDLVPNGAGIKVDVIHPAQVVRDVASAIDRFAMLTAEERSAMSRVGWEFSRRMTYSERASEIESIYLRILSPNYLPEVECVS